MLNFYKGLGAIENGLECTLMYFKRNKAQNNLISMSKIAPKHLDVGPDRRMDEDVENIIHRFFEKSVGITTTKQNVPVHDMNRAEHSYTTSMYILVLSMRHALHVL